MKIERSSALSKLELVIESLAIGRAAAAFLRGLPDPSHNPVATVVKMMAPGNNVHIKGTHCGFFTTPVIHAAILDVRRTLAFLRLRFEKSQTALESVTGSGADDDLLITDLGISAPSPEDLFGLSMRVLGKPGTNALLEVRRYASKELAHFTTAKIEPDLGDLADAMALMREAILVFVYDRLALPRPRPKLTIDDEANKPYETTPGQGGYRRRVPPRARLSRRR